MAGAPAAERPPHPASALALQFAESLELPVVLDQVACQLASLFQGVCQVQFSPACRPADARCTIAIPETPATTCSPAGATTTYAELLDRLEEHRRRTAPTLLHRTAGGECAARSGAVSPEGDGGAELLLAPLVARGRRIGTLHVVIPARSGSALRHDQRLLRELAAHAALAIDTADQIAQCQPTGETETGATPGRDVPSLFALLAHDLRAPLSTLSLSVQMIVRAIKAPSRPDADLARLVEVAEVSVAQLEAQVRALTPTASSAPAGGERAEATIDLVRLTRLMANFYQQTTGRHQLSVSADVSELPGRWARPQLERVLSNLLLNAIKYSPEGGEISVEVSSDEDALGRWATLSVQSRGPGIPLEDFPRLSQPGHRARNVGAIPGTGLGLASVREVVEQQGGSFAIQSELGGNTTVLVRLPVA